MKHPERNISIIEHIIEYCVEIEETIARFGNSYQTFSTDKIYKNAAAMCILQIGELVGHITEDFREKYSETPWRDIKAFRNIIAHQYGTVDAETTWEILTIDIPRLKEYCLSIVAAESDDNESSSEQN